MNKEKEKNNSENSFYQVFRKGKKKKNQRIFSFLFFSSYLFFSSAFLLFLFPLSFFPSSSVTAMEIAANR